MASVRIIVRGKVQGVGFRAFVRNLALGHGLRGEVWNRSDGAVELHATGDPHALESFQLELHQGPGRVEDVVVVPTDLATVSESFIISYSR